MAPDLLPWLNLAAALPLMWIAQRAYRFSVGQARGTTLVGPLRWLAVSIIVWLGAQLAAILPLGLGSGTTSRIGLFSLTLLLAPFVSVLGAKRPGARVWDLFIVLPMLVVVNWPAWAELLTGAAGETVDLEGPALAGLTVVIVMIAGNYFGTAFTGSMLAFSAGILAGLTSYSELLPVLGDGVLVPRLVTSVSLSVALIPAMRGAVKRSAARDGLEGAWLEFRDWFGILWAKRLMDRLNQTAAKDDWAVRVSLDGLHWSDDATAQRRSETSQEFERTFRWLLRRFADDAWLDRQISRREP